MKSASLYFHDLAKPHPKQESIWHRQYEDGYEKANLSDYPVAGSEVDAWKEGMYEARRLARSVGMAPDNDARGSDGDSRDDDDDHNNDSGVGDSSWFYRPFQYPANRFGDLQEGTQSSVQSSGGSDEEDVTAGGQCFSDDLRGIEAQDAGMTPLLDAVEMLDCDADGQSNTRNEARVTIPSRGTEIYKATLVSLLNQDPQLSHERLERVRQRQQYQRTEGPASASSGNSVSLFNDYAVLDREKMTFVLGNLIRMVLNGNHGRVDYKRPVNYDDSKKQSIICYFHVYSEVTRDGSVVRGKYKPSLSDIHEFPFSDIISHTNMSITEEGILTVPEEELMEIESTAATRLQPRPTRITRTRTSVERMASQFAFDEGIARTVVTPQQSSADGPRRSGRTRTVISYNTE